MKRAGTSGRSWAWLSALGLAFFLAGCMPSYYGAPSPPPAPPPPAPPPQVGRPVFYVTVNRLNLRACPGMDCPKVSVLERNEEVEQVGKAEDWSQVRVKRDGRLGWVSSRYLSAQPVAAAPEAAPAPAPAEPTPTVAPPLPPPVPVKPPTAEKPKPGVPGEAPPTLKKKVEEVKPPKAAKPAEAAEQPPRRRAAPAAEPPAPAKEKPAAAPVKPAPPPPAEKPAPPPEPAPEKPGGIRIM